MSFAVGQIVAPRRQYLGRRSVPTVTSSGRRIYPVEQLVDYAGRRSSVGIVLEALGEVPHERTFFDRSGRAVHRWLAFNVPLAAWTASTPYVAGDYVTSGGKTWRCTDGGTSLLVAPTGDDVTVIRESDPGPPLVLGPEWSEVRAPENSDGLTDVVRTSAVYQLRVWDIDGVTLSVDYYPESELAALTSFEAWRQLGSGDARSANPTTVLPFVASGHVDVLTDAKVQEMARAYELTGVDPRG